MEKEIFPTIYKCKDAKQQRRKSYSSSVRLKDETGFSTLRTEKSRVRIKYPVILKLRSIDYKIRLLLIM